MGCDTIIRGTIFTRCRPHGCCTTSRIRTPEADAACERFHHRLGEVVAGHLRLVDLRKKRLAAKADITKQSVLSSIATSCREMRPESDADTAAKVSDLAVPVPEHDGEMANPKVWVSTISRDVTLGAGGPGSHWEEVGTVDTVQETDLWKNIQVHLGLRSSAPRISGFYLHGVASTQWVVGASDPVDEGNPFWLAIDPFGDGTRYLVSVEQASIGTLARRPTESHPGLLERAVTLGIRVKKRDNRIFDSIGP